MSRGQRYLRKWEEGIPGKLYSPSRGIAEQGVEEASRYLSGINTQMNLHFINVYMKVY